ncbi:hypothetical protein [Paenibacillus sp. SN-8-1]|uniref:hypothetical protein n=1 Tax=Paenibacillus sp. SN-8-1 TaxID=3435409 RepID=UPI003D9A6FC6
MKRRIPFVLIIPALLLTLLPTVLQSPTLSDFSKGIVIGLFAALTVLSIVINVLTVKGIDLSQTRLGKFKRNLFRLK